MSSIPPPPPPGYRPPPPPGYPPPPPGIPPAQPAPRGCWRTGLVGCGIAGLALLLLIVAGFFYLRRNPQKITDFVMSQIESHYAPDVTPEDKRELREAYAAFREKMRSGMGTGRNSEEPFRRVQSVFMGTGSNNEITREQVHELTDSFRNAAGLPPLKRTPLITPPASPVTPAPGPAATPSP